MAKKKNYSGFAPFSKIATIIFNAYLHMESGVSCFSRFQALTHDVRKQATPSNAVLNNQIHIKHAFIHATTNLFWKSGPQTNTVMKPLLTENILKIMLIQYGCTNISGTAHGKNDPLKSRDRWMTSRLQGSKWAFKHSRILEIHPSLNFNGSFLPCWDGAIVGLLRSNCENTLPTSTFPCSA